jgi:hypothetical protein
MKFSNKNTSGIKAKINCIIILLSLLFFSALSDKKELAANGKILLAENGKTYYAIKVSPNDIRAKTAAKELAQHLKGVTGVEFPIEDNLNPSKSPVIAVGPDATKLLDPCLDISLKKLGNDGIVIKTNGDNLILTGAEDGKRGTLYAVYEFLENTVGCRWWTPTEAYVPNTERLEIPEINKIYVPELYYRETYYKNIKEPLFATRCRCNGNFEKIPEEYGGHIKFLGWCHTFYRLIPPGKYFKKHPEWFSEIDGKRTFKRAQLCLSNEKMRKELVNNALTWLRKNKGTGIISISQNDNQHYCQCKKCRKLDEQEGSPSGSLIKFINAVAEEIEKEFPDVYVENLAYQYTRRPPLTLKPRRNVIIRLATSGCSFSQPLGSSPQNEEFKADIEAWSKMAKQLFIWDYVTNFKHYFYPHPNLRVFAPNIRFFVKNKAIGVFANGDSHSPTGDFVDLRTWLLAHLMWNPSLDEKTLIRDFMDGYYGAASEPLRQYLDIIHDATKEKDTYLEGCMQGTPWLDLKTLNRSTELFDKAEKNVENNPVLRKRVRKTRLSLDYTWIRQYKMMKCIAKLKKMQFCGPSDIVAFCSDFIKTAHEFKMERVSEGRFFKDHKNPQNGIEPTLKPLFTNRTVIPDVCKGLEVDEWFDVQDSEFQVSGLDLLVCFVPDVEASDKSAAKMPGNHKERRAIQCPVYSLLDGLRCYAVIRCDVKPDAAKKGTAFRIGLKDRNNPDSEKELLSEQIENIDGKYHTYDLGVCNIKDGVIWIAADNNPDVNAIYVDRIIFAKNTK